jgi:hypothetical protein
MQTKEAGISVLNIKHYFRTHTEDKFLELRVEHESQHLSVNIIPEHLCEIL